MSDESFETIYRRYFDAVYRYALSLTQDAHRAEEICQETFFKALGSLDRFRGDSSIRTWLFSIVRNVFLSEQRKRPSLPLEEILEQPDDGAGPEELALRQDQARRLHQRLHQLPEPYKEVFSLRVFAQLSFRQIGELFGKTENWACVVYHRARAKLNDKEELS